MLLRKFGRSSKYDPAVEVVELMEVNLTYAHVKFSDGREDTVALRNLAPIPSQVQDETSSEKSALTDESGLPSADGSETDTRTDDAHVQDVQDSRPELRRSSRTSKPVDRLTYH